MGLEETNDEPSPSHRVPTHCSLRFDRPISHMQSHAMSAIDCRCPICNRWYRFEREGVSVCKSCGHEVATADPDAEVPRIEPNSKLLWVSQAMYFAGMAGLIFGILISLWVMIVGGVLFLVALVLGQSNQYRCGNCGCDITRWSKSCKLCGASFVFTVR